jgi:hypothetical protein
MRLTTAGEPDMKKAPEGAFFLTEHAALRQRFNAQF